MLKVGVVEIKKKKKNTWKLENVVSTIYKTKSNINTVFAKLLANEIHISNFFTMDDIGWKSFSSDHIPVQEKFVFQRVQNRHLKEP